MIIYEILFMQNNRDTWNCVQFLLALYLGKKWKSTDDTKFSQGTKYRKSNTVMLSLKIK